MRFASLLLVVFFAFCASARADLAFDEQYKAFNKLVREEIARPEFKTALVARLGNQSYQQSAANIIARLETRPISVENVTEVVRAITLTRPSEKISAAGDAVIARITQLSKANTTQQDVVISSIAIRVRDACLNAQKPSDLDAVIASLTPYRTNLAASERRGDADENYRAISLLNLAETWRKYLQARSDGDVGTTNSALQQIQSSADPKLFPRSKILLLRGLPLIDSSRPATSAKNTPPAAAPATTAALQAIAPQTALARLEPIGLDQLEDVAGVLADYFHANKDNPPLFEISQRIQLVLNHKKALQKGQVAFAVFNSSGAPGSSAVNPLYTEKLSAAFDRWNSELRLQSLQTVFKDSPIKPSVDEPVDVYILRVAQAAVDVENWEYALRTLEFYRALFPANTAPAWVSREIGCCILYTGARRLDEASQFPQAIQAYQDALRSAGRLAPVKLIAARLEELRKTQPDAFAEANRIPRTPIQVQLPGSPATDRNINQTGPAPTYLVPRIERPL